MLLKLSVSFNYPILYINIKLNVYKPYNFGHFISRNRITQQLNKCRFRMWQNRACFLEQGWV